MTGHPYSGARVAFATMHGKEHLAREPFRNILQAAVTAVPDLDTDQFGTFAGEIQRTLSPVEAARTKVRLGMRRAGSPFGLASEGTFSSGFGLQTEHHEVLLFADDTRGFELLEATVTSSPLVPARRVTSVDAGVRFAEAAGFPRQGIVLTGGAAGTHVFKNFAKFSALTEQLDGMFGPGDESVTIAPDYRAHRCPSRREVITALARRMALRLDTACPSCDAPGFGRVDVERGLPCADCDSATRMIAADVFRCVRCPATERRPRNIRAAAAEWCDHCNP